MSKKVIIAEWPVTTLGELGKIVTGKTPKTKDSENFNGDILFVKPGDLNDSGYIIKTADTLSNIGFELVPKLPEKSIMVTCIGNLGKIGITTRPSSTNQQINSVIPNDGVYYKYLYYYLSSMGWWLEQEASATTVSIINKGKFSKAPVLLPPFAEQQEIAARLDIMLAQVDTIKGRLDALPAILKRFRQSVLAAAVSGKLTEEWREVTDYDTDGYPCIWEKKGFSDVGELARGKSKHRPRNDPRLFGDEYPFIQTGEVANSGGRITSASKYYSEFGLAQSKLFPADTLCITIAANIADTAILNIDACFPDSVVGFTANRLLCEVPFVKYLVDANKENLERFAPATAQKNINLKVLNELRLPFPPLAEQTEIIRRVEQLFAFADKIEQRVNDAQARVNHLTQSILAKAFRGELTADWRQQNPELISGENSAEALLARIQAERAAQKPVKRAVKKKAQV